MSETIAVSYSKVKAWRFCRQNYWYKYHDRIVPKRKPKPLKIGSLVHEVLEAMAKKQDWRLLISAAQKEYNKMFAEEKEFYGNYPEDVERIIKGYIRHYKDEPFLFSCPETTFGPIPLSEETSFKFKVDKLAQPQQGVNKGDLFLWETKTGRRIPQDDMRIWDLQTVVYIWGLKQCGKPVKGIIWDYLRTKAPTVPAVLKNGTLSRAQNIDTDYFTYLEAIRNNGEDPKDYADFLESLKNRDVEFYKRVMVPISNAVIDSVVSDFKQTSREIYYLEDSPVKSISGYTCPRCDYSSICYAGIRGSDEAFIRKTEFVVKPDEEDQPIVDESDVD